jgi:hypothetical protein
MPTPAAITSLPEYGSIESVPLAAGTSVANYAWLATDLADVRQPARLRGGDRILPGAPGVSVRAPRRKTSSRRLIPMLFTGDCESDGTTAIHDPDEQVWINFDEFVQLVIDPDATATRTLTVVHKSLTYAGEVVIEDWEYRLRGPSEITGVLDISIPAGRLTLTVGS